MEKFVSLVQAFAGQAQEDAASKVEVREYEKEDLLREISYAHRRARTWLLLRTCFVFNFEIEMSVQLLLISFLLRVYKKCLPRFDVGMVRRCMPRTPVR